MHRFPMLVLKWSNLYWTSQHPGAAQVHVALLLQVFGAKAAEHRQSIIVWVVIVPLIARRVDEQDIIGKVVVVVDDEAVG